MSFLELDKCLCVCKVAFFAIWIFFQLSISIFFEIIFFRARVRD